MNRKKKYTKELVVSTFAVVFSGVIAASAFGGTTSGNTNSNEAIQTSTVVESNYTVHKVEPLDMENVKEVTDCEIRIESPVIEVKTGQPEIETPVALITEEKAQDFPDAELVEESEETEETVEELQEVTKAVPYFLTERMDPNYYPQPIHLDANQKDLVARLVMGEAGAEGYEGQLLVAQTIRDTMVADNCYDLLTIKKRHGYSGSIKKTPTDSVRTAVTEIFDNGAMAVQHPLKYFYAFKVCKSKFHESQLFVIQHGGHRFFAER